MIPKLIVDLETRGSTGAWSTRHGYRGKYPPVTSKSRVLVLPRGRCHSSPVGCQRFAMALSYGGLILAGLVMASSAAFAGAIQTTVVAWGNNTLGQCDVPVGLTNVVAIAAGGSYTLALREDGRVVAWGDNQYGQIRVPQALTGVIAISAGNRHSLALKRDGTVVAWGGNGYYAVTNVPANLDKVVAIAAGGTHDLAMKSDGTVTSWGKGPDVPAGFLDVTAISAARMLEHGFDLALKRDGTVIGWGWWPRPTNSAGDIVLPSSLTNVVALSAGMTHALALKEDGTVVACGSTFGSQGRGVPPGLTDVVAIAAGDYFDVGLRRDRTVVEWKYDGKWEDVPAGLTNVAAIAAGSSHSVALIGDGAPFITLNPVSRTRYIGESVVFQVWAGGAEPLVYQWQQNGQDIPGATNSYLTLTEVHLAQVGSYTVMVSNAYGQVASAPAILTAIVSPPIVAVEPLALSQCVRSSATLTATVGGSHPLNLQWQHNGTNIDGATELALTFGLLHLSDSGYYRVIASNSYGSAYSQEIDLKVSCSVGWGESQFGQTIMPPDVTNAVAIAAGGRHALALRATGKVVAWGDDGSGQIEVPPGLDNVVAISAGNLHSLALKQDGTVVAWGNNSSRQTNVPPGLDQVVAIAAGGIHSLALKSDGSIVSWGDTHKAVPVDFTNAVSVAAGSTHSLALCADGTVVAWGLDGSVITQLPKTLSNVVAIAAGYWHDLALLSDGTVVSWGSQSSVPKGLTNIVSIAAGNNFSMALKDDGTVVAWGKNDLGQTKTPVWLTNVTSIAAGYTFGLALVKDPSPVPPTLSSPAVVGDRFQTTVFTERGSSYRLEFAVSLEGDDWTMLQPVPGDDAMRVLADPNPIGLKRFYRVRRQP
ncbi:MAG: hypothetical protein M1608_05735 [Candidatus Omnitrophica bacterium]|nr:hypothetical protein [Candidatus Omnitrophota bacterium]